MTSGAIQKTLPCMLLVMSFVVRVWAALGDSKVWDLAGAVRSKDVVSFEVTMEDTFAIRICQSNQGFVRLDC